MLGYTFYHLNTCFQEVPPGDIIKSVAKSVGIVVLSVVPVGYYFLFVTYFSRIATYSMSSGPYRFVTNKLCLVRWHLYVCHTAIDECKPERVQMAEAGTPFCLSSRKQLWSAWSSFTVSYRASILLSGTWKPLSSNYFKWRIMITDDE